MLVKELTTATVKGCPAFTYGTDGNKVVRHLYDLVQITDTMFITPPEPDNWGQLYSKIIIKFPDVPVGMSEGSIRIFDDCTTEDISKYGNGVRDEADIITSLDRLVDRKLFIGMREITFVAQFNPEKAREYLLYRNSYIEEREKREAEEAAKQEAEDAAYVEEMNSKADLTVSSAIGKLKSGGMIENSKVEIFKSRYDSNEYALVNLLMRRFGVNVPLRTQGWINDSMASAKIEDGKCASVRYYRKNGGRGSKTIYEYMDKLITAAISSES